MPPASESLHDFFARVRRRSVDLCAPLAPEDTVVQSMPDASPVKWHLAHTTWFFEKFVLSRNRAWQPRHPDWHFLFNSYYQSVGPMHARAQRGLLSRPTLAEVLDYRRHVDDGVCDWLHGHPDDHELAARVTLGLHHEQQHQELMLTDIKHLFSLNPLEPAYAEAPPIPDVDTVPMRFIEGLSGIVENGHAGNGFAYDNERPRHRELLYAHALANRPVNNAEFRQFIDDGGYRTPTLWMSEGWACVEREGWAHPMYWSDDLASEFTLTGRREIDPHAPVCHVSYYEADAFARWAGARLPREAEWETLPRMPMRMSAISRKPGCCTHARPKPAPATGRCNCSAMSGNGRAALMSPIPASNRWKAPWASTTASSCAASGCCAAVRAPRRPATCAPAIATFSTRRTAGNSWAFGSGGTHEHARTGRAPA